MDYKNISLVESLCYSPLISFDKRLLKGNIIETFKMSTDIKAFKTMSKLNNINCLKGVNLKF